jgi:uncharacterized membrane protein YgcG
MTDRMIDPQLSASLDAWRQSSRLAPRRHARERAHDAMLEAMVAASRRGPARSFFSLRPRFGHAGLIASTATIVAAASVAAAGWNAPPGSALFVVRAARQGVMLKLPGSNDATLHLEFAEQSLADARERINPAQSLTDASAELAAAFTELPSDQTTPLWARYHLDETTLVSEESEFETESPTAPPTTAHPEPTEDDQAPAGTGPAQGGGDGEDSASPTTSHGSPSSSYGRGGGDGGGGGGDDGGSGPSHSPGQSPPPDD